MLLYLLTNHDLCVRTGLTWTGKNNVQPSAFFKKGREFIDHLWDFNHLSKDVTQRIISF